MIIRLIVKEIIYRKFSFLLAVLAVTFAVAFFVFFVTANQASTRETIRLTRDMGYNLRIIPKDTDMNAFWTTGYSEYTMPEEYVNRFLQFKDFSFAHLTATLQTQIRWQNRDVILTGIAPEVEPSGVIRSSMIFTVEPGQVYVGYELANDLNLTSGDEIEILGNRFTIARTLSETGSNDDIRIYGTLGEFQELVDSKGMINEIMALNCLCISPEENDPLVILREQLDQVLPEAKVVMNTTIANARERQRHMLEEYFGLSMIIVIVVIAIWVGSLAMINTKQRERETGILHATGQSIFKILVIFLGKALVIGIISAIIGFGIGTVLALEIGPGIFMVTKNSIKPIYALLGWAILCTPLFTMLSSYLPTLIAVMKDPAVTLRTE
jgi:ABC-type lipoprotein release transport system permease subunit